MQRALSIRTAKAEDAEAIARLSARTFRDTFATKNNTADVERYPKVKELLRFS